MKHFKPSVSLVSQRLRNIQDFLTISSLHLVPSLYSCQEKSTPEKSHILSNNNLESSFSSIPAKVNKKETLNTMFVLVPFVQSMYHIWKTTVEYKLAVKNIEPVSSLKRPVLTDKSKV